MREIALDTNIAIDLLNGKPEIIAAVSQFDFIYLPVTVCGELLFGAKNSGKPKLNELKYKRFINACILLETNQLVAEKYAEIRLELKEKGRPIPENDIWIAAICTTNGIELFTRDDHFSNIAQLKLYSMNS
jgi:tRNA(fMet)-specific endonuclease VapC